MTLLRPAAVFPPSVAACLVLSLACSGEAPADQGSGGGSSSGGVASGAGGSSSGGSGADPSGGADSGSSPSGGSESGSGGESAVDDDSIGLVQVYRTLAHSQASRASVAFDLEEQAAWDALGEGQPACVTTAYGDCRLTVCPPPTDPDPDVDPDDLPSLARLEAGTISVSSDSNEFTATGDPSGTNGTYVISASGSFAGEEIVTMSAAGGTIEAFAGTIQMPLAPLLTSPAVSGEVAAVTSIPVSREANYEFGWDARDTGDTLEAIVLLPEDAPETTPSLSCTFDAGAGTGVLLAEALQQLPVGTAIHFFSVNRGEVETAQGTVRLAAFFELLSQDKTVHPRFVLE